MNGIGFDPYCLKPQGAPEPVGGLLPPAVALVDDELPPARPLWLRFLAAAVLLVFAVLTALSSVPLLGARVQAPPLARGQR